MSHNTPDNLLKLAADLNKLGGELCAIGGKLATAAKALEEEAANVALANAQRWGVDVQVCNSLGSMIRAPEFLIDTMSQVAVRAGPHGQWVGQGNEIVVNGAKK
jgi:hypothetical protein